MSQTLYSPPVPSSSRLVDGPADPPLSETDWEVKARLAGYGTPLLLAWRDHPHFPPVPLTDCLKSAWKRLMEQEGKAAKERLHSLLCEVLMDRGYGEPDTTRASDLAAAARRGGSDEPARRAHSRHCHLRLPNVEAAMSAKASPTPGPWKVRNEEHSRRWTSDLIIVDPAAEGSARQIVFVSLIGGDRARQRANARLIAAAPDFFEAAKSTVGRLSDLPRFLRANGLLPLAEIAEEELAKHSAALAKAEVAL